MKIIGYIDNAKDRGNLRRVSRKAGWLVNNEWKSLFDTYTKAQREQAFIDAVRCGDPTAIDTLLDYSQEEMDVNAHDDKSGETALIAAVRIGDVELVELLLSLKDKDGNKRVDVNVPKLGINKFNQSSFSEATALYYAAMGNKKEYIEIVEFF